MNPASSKKDRETFLKALMLWDRPESQFGGKCIEGDVDIDDFIDGAFALPSRGVVGS